MRRIVEDPEQHQWIGSVMPGEVRLFQAEAERNGCHEGVTELSHRCEVFEDDRPELRQVRGKKIRTVQGRAGLHERMSGIQLRAEIDALFHVGISRCEFTADREVSSPRAASARHGNFQLCRKVLREKPPADFFKPFLKVLLYSVPNCIKESELAARLSDLSRDVAAVFVRCSQRADVDDRNLHAGFASLNYVTAVVPYFLAPRQSLNNILGKTPLHVL